MTDLKKWDEFFNESFSFGHREGGNIFSGPYDYDRKVCSTLLSILCDEFEVSEKDFSKCDKLMNFINSIYHNTGAIKGLNSMGDLSKPMRSIIEKYSLTGARINYCAESIYAKLGLAQFKDIILNND